MAKVLLMLIEHDTATDYETALNRVRHHGNDWTLACLKAFLAEHLGEEVPEYPRGHSAAPDIPEPEYGVDEVAA